jgi:hypothetical protein
MHLETQTDLILKILVIWRACQTSDQGHDSARVVGPTIS